MDNTQELRTGGLHTRVVTCVRDKTFAKEKMKLSLRECVAAVPSETSPVGNSSLMITPQ